MAKIYSAPESIEVPSWDAEDWEKEENRYIEELRKYCLDDNSGSYIGKVANFSIADGYASYMIASIRPLELIHMETGDAYEYPHIERLNAKDIKQNIDFQESLKKLRK